MCVAGLVSDGQRRRDDGVTAMPVWLNRLQCSGWLARDEDVDGGVVVAPAISGKWDRESERELRRERLREERDERRGPCTGVRFGQSRRRLRRPVTSRRSSAMARARKEI